MRALLARQDPSATVDETGAGFRQLLDGAWFTFEGSATYQETCLEILSEDGPNLEAIFLSLPERYRAAHALLVRDARTGLSSRKLHAVRAAGAGSWPIA